MTVRDVRHGRRFLGNRLSGRFSYGLVMGLLLAVLLIAVGCVTEEPKDNPFENLVSSLGGKRHRNTAADEQVKALSQSPEKAVPGDSSSPEVKARRKAWRAACKAVAKVLVKQYAARSKPGFAYPVILPMGTGRYHIYGYANSVAPNGLLLQRAFEAWIERHGGRTKCESLTIDGQPVP